MKKRFSKCLNKKVLNIAFIFTFMISLFSIGISNAFAASTVSSYNYNLTVKSWGGVNAAWKTDTMGYNANYIKVTINTSGGDKFDLRLVYTDDWVSERKVLANVNGLSAKGKSYTYYFIPKNGACPGSSSQCITVPIVKTASDADHAALATQFFGIEFKNGSLLGGDLKVSGTFALMNY